MEIRRLQPGDETIVMSGSDLFDNPPTGEWTQRFLAATNHHLLVALHHDRPVGFVSGVETVHPDKGAEMFLYELGVHPDHRRRGVGKALVRELSDLARQRGCYGMFVLTGPDDPVAVATYRSAGSSPPDSTLLLEWRFDDPGSRRRPAEGPSTS